MFGTRALNFAEVFWFVGLFMHLYFPRERAAMLNNADALALACFLTNSCVVNVACLIHKIHTMRADKRIFESHRGCTSGMLGINYINILLFLAHNTGTL